MFKSGLGQFLSVFSKLLMAVAIIGLGVIGFRVLVATKPEVSPQPRQEVVRQVTSHIVKIEDARPVLRAFGSVSATRTANLSFAIAGEVSQVSEQMRNGAFVAEGDELARLDDELLELARNEIELQLAAEEVNVAELEIQLDLRQRQFERITQMKAASVASLSVLEESRLALSMAKNALSQSRSRVLQLQIALRRAEKNLSDTVLRAPFTGVLSKIEIGEGRVLSTSTSLGTITDLSSLEVSFVVPASVYAAYDDILGQKVDISWKTGGRSVSTVDGRIVRAESNVTASEGGGRFYAVLPGPGKDQHAPIPAGAFVEVEFASVLLEDIAIIPEAALFDNDTVFVIIDGRAQARKVVIEAKTNGKIYVSDGLENNDEIVTTRIPGLGEGVRVEADRS
ncbi:efflux RND transporter periplasmic adaptor subunit [Alphaproteobacteria bacterium LSUCC0684]